MDLINKYNNIINNNKIELNKLSEPVSFYKLNENIYLFGDVHYSLENKCEPCDENNKCLTLYDLFDLIIQKTQKANKKVGFFVETRGLMQILKIYNDLKKKYEDTDDLLYRVLSFGLLYGPHILQKIIEKDNFTPEKLTYIGEIKLPLEKMIKLYAKYYRKYDNIHLYGIDIRDNLNQTCKIGIRDNLNQTGDITKTFEFKITDNIFTNLKNVFETIRVNDWMLDEDSDSFMNAIIYTLNFLKFNLRNYMFGDIDYLRDVVVDDGGGNYVLGFLIESLITAGDKIQRKFKKLQYSQKEQLFLKFEQIFNIILNTINVNQKVLLDKLWSLEGLYTDLYGIMKIITYLENEGNQNSIFIYAGQEHIDNYVDFFRSLNLGMSDAIHYVRDDKNKPNRCLSKKGEENIIIKLW